MDEWLLDASIAELDVGPATAYRRVREACLEEPHQTIADVTQQQRNNI